MDNHNPRTKGLLNILALSMWTPLWLAIALVLALAGGVNLFLGQVGAFAFVELGIFFVYFFFKVSQTVVERIHVVLDACHATVELIHHFFAFKFGFLLLSCGHGSTRCKPPRL